MAIRKPPTSYTPSLLLPEAVARRADIASYSHGLIDIADRLQRLEPRSSVERDMMLRDQFVENVRDVPRRWDMKRRIEEDAAVGFLALRKVALRWFDEGATTSK